MNLDFSKTGIGRAENAEGALVRSAARELLMYERPGLKMPIEINFLEDVALIYIPMGGEALLNGFPRSEVLAEIRAGAQVVARCEVRWG